MIELPRHVETKTTGSSESPFLEPPFQLPRHQAFGLFCFYLTAISGPSQKEAARRVGVTTPTMSEQMKKLEVACQRDLLAVYAKQSWLTKDGLALFEFIREPMQKLMPLFSDVAPGADVEPRTWRDS